MCLCVTTPESALGRTKVALRLCIKLARGKSSPWGSPAKVPAAVHLGRWTPNGGHLNQALTRLPTAGVADTSTTSCDI